MSGQGRFDTWKPFRTFGDRDWQALDVLRTVAAQVDRSLAQVALAWATAQPGITALLLGASKPEQLRDNVASLDINLTSAQRQMLDESSALAPTNPYAIFSDEVNRGVFGGATVQSWR